MLNIMPYHPEVVHDKETEMFIADIFSRDCNLNSNLDLLELQMEIHVFVPMTESKTI